MLAPFARAAAAMNHDPEPDDTGYRLVIRHRSGMTTNSRSPRLRDALDAAISHGMRGEQATITCVQTGFVVYRGSAR